MKKPPDRLGDGSDGQVTEPSCVSKGPDRGPIAGPA